jgi:predicted RNA binding protein YcfA (HicA-like mRNA interferase family)
MNQWPSTKARTVLAALIRIGWSIKRDSAGSHRILSRPGWPDYVFAFHEGEEIGPRMLSRIAKKTGIRPDDL